MNNKMLAIGVVLSAALVAGVFATTPLAFAYDGGDESETNTEQRLKQKNVGSGASTNFNCGENSIKGGEIDVQACGTAELDAESLRIILRLLD
jgi:hypothetical protein